MSFARIGSVLLLAAAMLMSSSASGVDRNGHWWSLQDRGEKASYLMGLLDGMRDARAAAGCPPTCEDAPASPLHDGVSLRELSNGLDVLYEEHRNRALPIPAALRIVAARLRGGDPASHPER